MLDFTFLALRLTMLDIERLRYLPVYAALSPNPLSRVLCVSGAAFSTLYDYTCRPLFIQQELQLSLGSDLMHSRTQPPELPYITDDLRHALESRRNADIQGTS